nr:hypothetical protein [Tanacetum cinerariifolium]
METTIDQQVALDESLVPSTQRLRIGRSNFRLPSDIQSKESTLQVVYDVLRNSPLFRAFQVTADIDTKKSVLDLEAFREMLRISPRIPSHSFAELPSEEEILDFLSHEIRYLTDVNVNKLYQPWRSFTSVINKCLTGKSSGVDNFRLSQAQILWGFYHRINIDFAYLIWEDFVYQVVSRHQTTQQYGAILPIELTTDEIRNSKAYKEYYACATGEAAPKPKASARKKKGDSASSTTPPTPTPTTTVESAPRLSTTAKGKQPARAITPTEPTDVQRTEAEQLKITLKRSKQETHISQQRGSCTDEGTGSRPGVSDVPSDDSEEELSWNSFDDKEDDDDNDDEEEPAKKNDEDTESGKGGDEVNESEGESEEEETRQEEEESFDPIPRTPEGSEDESNDEEDQELRLSKEVRIQEEEEADKLYRDVNINQGRGLQVTQNVEDSHVTLTPVNPDGPQESSSMSSFVTSMLNPTSDVGVESIFTKASSSIVSLQTQTPIMTPSTIATIKTSSEAPIPPTTIPSIILENLPTFNSAFCFDERLRSLETSFSEYRQTILFVDAVSAILGIVQQYITQQMTEAVREAVQIQTDRLQDSL